MITGVIYKYTSPSGKSYIGQTTRENYRRRMWFSTGRYTGGKSKIDRARRKYGPCNFLYEVLFKKEYNNVDEATRELNILESYFIGYYDTYKNGYNSTLGGDGSRGYKPSYETRIKISKATKGLKKPLNNILPKKRRKDCRIVLQLDLNGNLIQEFPSIQDAADSVGVSGTNISACCRGKVNKIKGFKWRYKNDNIS